MEDDPVQQIVLRSALQVQGYTVDIAQDGGRAVRMIREGAYDLVLFDYQIPEMDGLAASRLILGLMGESQRPRMIALTGRPEKLTARQSASGPSFDAVIPKTTDMTDLLATIERMLRLSPRPSTRRKAISSDIARGLVRPPIGADLPVFDLETFERARGMLAPEALAALGRDITRRSLGLLQKLRETPPNGLARTADVSKESNVLASVAALFGFERLAYLARGYARACAKSSPDILAYGENFATIIENTVLRIRSGTLPEDGPFPLDGGEAGSGADVLPGC